MFNRVKVPAEDKPTLNIGLALWLPPAKPVLGYCTSIAYEKRIIDKIIELNRKKIFFIDC